MNKELKIKSPTGIVHYVDSYHEGAYVMGMSLLCGYVDYDKNDEWIETKQSVTCKRCLRQKLLNETKDDKYTVHICHSHINPKKDVISVSNFLKSSLLKTLMLQGYVTKPLKKDEQIAILIYKE